jgi:hypothetical protein
VERAYQYITGVVFFNAAIFDPCFGPIKLLQSGILSSSLFQQAAATCIPILFVVMTN